MKSILGPVLGAALLLPLGQLSAEETTSDQPNLRILDKDTVFVVESGEEPLEVTRRMTDCAKNKGWLQPLIPVEGVNPVTEIEVLHAMNDDDAILIDMREMEWFVDATIPTAINIPYTEVAMRLDELGCERDGEGWNCAGAKKVFAFCNGPVCPQSPTAMRAMVRDGFPAEKIYYYRGGMMDWDVLGLTTVEGDL